jgi:hypothetical protein
MFFTQNSENKLLTIKSVQFYLKGHIYLHTYTV